MVGTGEVLRETPSAQSHVPLRQGHATQQPTTSAPSRRASSCPRENEVDPCSCPTFKGESRLSELHHLHLSIPLLPPSMIQNH